ncbi:MAG: hypothetical protein VKJ24_12810 [Synechococcales bacterium]|nr:hypothetical protein [Synechococcales bacterium]
MGGRSFGTPKFVGWGAVRQIFDTLKEPPRSPLTSMVTTPKPSIPNRPEPTIAVRPEPTIAWVRPPDDYVLDDTLMENI